MDLSSIFSILVRRWYAVLPVLVLVVVAGYGEVSRVKTPYEATAKMLLFSPSTFVNSQGNPERTNPFTSFDRSLNITATALTEGAASSARFSEAITTEGLTNDWQATVSGTDPIITVTARSPIRAKAIATAGAVARLLTTQLAAMQHSVAAPPSQLITARVIVPAQSASALTTDRNRALAGTIILGILAVVAAGLAAESASDRRRRRRRPVQTDRGVAPSTGPDPGAREFLPRKVSA